MRKIRLLGDSIADHDVLKFIRAILRGVGQIFLQRSAWCGLAVIGALTLPSSYLAFACLLGSLLGTLLGYAFYDSDPLEDGLHGYNGALAGLAVLVFLGPSVVSWCIAPLSSVLATWIGHAWRKHLPFSPYTLPFVLVTWGLVALAGPLDLPQAAPIGSNTAEWGFFMDGILRGVGQVVFLNLSWAAVLCVLGLALSNIGAAAYAVVASAVGLSCAYILNLPGELIVTGFYGFNAALTVLSLEPNQYKQWWPFFFGIALSLAITRGFQLAGIPPLTAPFVLSAWILKALPVAREEIVIDSAQ